MASILTMAKEGLLESSFLFGQTVFVPCLVCVILTYQF